MSYAMGRGLSCDAVSYPLQGGSNKLSNLDEFLKCSMCHLKW